jgi:riboflavin synthase
MFTGIVEETGTIESIDPLPASIRLRIRAQRCATTLTPGASLAVNGCCLTVTRLAGPRSRRRLEFHLLEETWRLTNFHTLRPGARVNLERPMAANGRFDGHIVTGHIDEAAPIRRWQQVGNDWLLEIAPSKKLLRQLVHKGSIAVDGISLTVAKLLSRSFQIWIIPHTLQVTRLSSVQRGDLVNLEADILAKHVARLLGK